MSILIDNPGALRAAAAEAEAAACVAVDTEFVWERSFYPKLGLIQLGLPNGTVHLVDALAIHDFASLRAVIENPSVVKVLHDAGQDLQILRRVTRAKPRNVFDTRVASGFAGIDSTISLSNLLRTLLNVELPKTETRTNWLKRPLSDEQVLYAVDDVRYLPAAREALLTRVAERGLRAWLDEELSLLDDPRLYAERDVDSLLQRLRLPGDFGKRETTALRELLDWREQEARERDRPRAHVIPDAALFEVARRLPNDLKGLHECPGLSDAAVHRHGATLLALVRRVMLLASSALVDPSVVKEAAGQRERVRLLQAQVRALAEARGVDPQLVCGRADLVRLINDPHPEPERHRVLRGWRGELMGQALTGKTEQATCSDGGIAQ